jgi:hypothetical protein
MALNSGGISIPFSAKDDGYTKNVGMFTKATGLFTGSINTLSNAGTTIGQHIQNLADDFKITTTNTEAFGIAASKISAHTLAGLNLTSKQMGAAKSQITGIAYGLNMDVGAVADSFKALQQSQVDVKKIGFGSFSEFQRFITVAGVDAKAFAATIGKMRSQFHMTDDQIKDTITSTIALGKHFNMGAEAAQGISNTIGVLANEGATLWAELGPEKTKQFLEGTQELSIAYMNAGNTAEDAQKLALSFGQAMIKSRAGVQDLYSGLTEDLSPAAEVLTENFGSVEIAFQSLQNSPGELAKRLVKAAGAIQKTAKSPEQAQMALARFSGQIAKTFGPEAAALIGGSNAKTQASFEAVDKELNKPGGLADKNGVLKQMANNYESGLTPTELLARATDQFRTKLKGLMHETDAQFLDRFNKSAAVTEDKLSQIANRGGLLGKATSMMVEFSMHGLGGVASMVSKNYGPAMAVLIQQFGPVIQNLHNLLPLLTMFANPIVLIGAALAGAAVYLDGFGGSAEVLSATLDNWIDKAGEFASKAIDTIVRVAPIVFNAVGKALAHLWNAINWKKVEEVALKIGETLWDGIKTIASKIPDLAKKITEIFMNIDWSAVWAKAKDALVDAGKGLVTIGQSIGTEIAHEQRAAAVAGMNGIGKIWEMLPTGMEQLNDAGLENQKEFLTVLDAQLRRKFAGMTEGMTAINKIEADKRLEELRHNLERQYTSMVLNSNLTEAESIKLTERLIANSDAQAAAATGNLNQVTEASGKMVMQVGAAIGPVVDNMVSKAGEYMKVFSTLIGHTNKAAADAAEVQQATVESLGVSADDSNKLIEKMIGGNKTVIVANINEIGNAYKSFLKSIQDVSTTMLTATKKNVNDIYDLVKVSFPKMEEIVNKFITNTSRALTNYWSNILTQTKNSFTQIFAAADTLLLSLADKAAKMNLLDAMTPQSVMDSWAIKIVATLQRTFASNLNLGPAIQTALGNVKDLSAQLGVTGPDNRVPAKAAAIQVASGESANNLLDMLRAINMPTWGQQLLDAEAAQNADLIKRLNLLIEVTAMGKKLSDKQQKSEGLLGINPNENG